MPAPRIVFCDMDGTLLASDKSLPDINLRALDWLAAHDIPFVPCTGRPISAVPALVARHPSVQYAIGANGAVVFDMHAHANIIVRGIDKESVIALYRHVCDWPLTFDVFADGVVYSERARYDSMGSLGIHPATLATLRVVRTPTDLMVPQIVERATCVEKITCFFGDLALRAALEQAANEVGGFAFACGDPNDLELMASGVSKGSALVWLCDYLGISVEDACAFGDEENDISMIRAAGIGVAMKNATEDVLAVANHVTVSNDEGGVGHFLLDV